MEQLVSVIIPVYNAGKYLKDCLDSVVGQTLAPGELDIVLVDDKSSDGSLTVCETYARRHRNIRVFPLPERTPGGCGFPTNVGIKNARGRYIGFLDCDDYAAPEMFEELFTAAEDAEADITLCSFTMAVGGEGAKAPPYDIHYWTPLFAPDFPRLPETERKNRFLKTAPAAWRKLYRRNFLLKNKLLFPVGNYFFEDNTFHWTTIIKAGTITALDKRLVTHRERPGQTTAMDQGRAALHIAEQMRLILHFLRNNALAPTYRDTFRHLASETLARVPEDHPEFRTIVDALADVCSF